LNPIELKLEMRISSPPARIVALTLDCRAEVKSIKQKMAAPGLIEKAILRLKKSLGAGVGVRLYRTLLDALNAFAYCRMSYKGGKPCDFIFLLVNKAFGEQTGIRNAQGRWVGEVLPGIRETDPLVFEIFGRVASTGKAEKFEYFLRSLDRWFSISVTSPAKGFFVSVFEEITERKRWESEIFDTKAFLDGIMENSPYSMWISDDKGTLVRMNQACRDALRLKDEEVVGKYNILRDNLLEAQGHMEEVKTVFQEGRAARFVTSYDTAAVEGLSLGAGAKAILDVSIAPVFDIAGTVNGAVIQYIDISERMDAEKKLAEQEVKYRAVFENSQDAIGVHFGGIWETCNPAAIRLFGLSSEDELIGKPIIDVLAPSERESIIEYVRARMSANEAPDAHITKGLRSDGTEFEMEVDLSSYILEDKRHALVILRDVSERERHAAEIKESETKYRLLLENMLEGFALHEIITDEHGEAVDFRFLDANPAYERHTGLRIADIVGKTMLEIMPQTDKSRIKAYGDVALTGSVLSFEYYSKTFGRHLRVKSFRPKPGRFATIFEDITDLKQAELEVKAKSDELEAILTTMTTGISRVKDRRIVWANPMHDIIFGYPPGETVGKDTAAFYPDAESTEHFASEIYPALPSGNPFSSELLMKRQGGELFWCSLTGRLIDASRPEEGSIWTVRDISDRKRAQAELQAALRNNQDLLHEIQHRAKNSFSMISSMIAMTASEGIPAQAVPILEELDVRIRSIAELYSLLYSSGNFNELRLDDYITRILRSLGAFSKCVTISAALESLVIPSREAAPIGLIITELVTNSIKYAFPSGRSGKIALSLRKELSKNLLEIEDDGIGLPEGFDISTHSGMGLNLVIALASQIGGEFSILNASQGTKSRIAWER
jgi:PAS domain S-box-containing protein